MSQRTLLESPNSEIFNHTIRERKYIFMEKIIEKARNRVSLLKEGIASHSDTLADLKSNLDRAITQLFSLESELNHLRTLRFLLTEDSKFNMANLVAAEISSLERSIENTKVIVKHIDYDYQYHNKENTKNLCELAALTAELESLNG